MSQLLRLLSSACLPRGARTILTTRRAGQLLTVGSRSSTGPVREPSPPWLGKSSKKIQVKSNFTRNLSLTIRSTNDLQETFKPFPWWGKVEQSVCQTNKRSLIQFRKKEIEIFRPAQYLSVEVKRPSGNRSCHDGF